MDWAKQARAFIVGWSNSARMGVGTQQVAINELTEALHAAHHRGMEKAAKLAETYSLGNPELYPGVNWKDANESAKTGCHVASQEIAAAIRADMEKDGD